MDLTVNISSILNSSVIDGPGNRMVIFFQSCQFNCMYCHNSHTIGLCNLCGTCVDICPTHSLEIKDKQLIHSPSSCIRCDECLKQCPENSSPFYRKYTVDTLISEILKVRDFISGITLSGGEVMLQYKFIKAFFTAIRNNEKLKDLSLFIDSNGDIDQTCWEEVLPLTDGCMIDLKAYSPQVHKKLTGRDNKKVLKSIAYLNSRNKLYEVRTVIVPGINNCTEEIIGLKHIYQSLSKEVRKVLIRMRKHGIREEYKKLEVPSNKEMETIQDLLKDIDLITI